MLLEAVVRPERELTVRTRPIEPRLHRAISGTITGGSMSAGDARVVTQVKPIMSSDKAVAWMTPSFLPMAEQQMTLANEIDVAEIILLGEKEMNDEFG